MLKGIVSLLLLLPGEFRRGIGSECCIADRRLAGIVLVVPYSLLANKYGVKRIIILSIFGVLLGEIWYDLVCKSASSLFAPNLWSSNVYDDRLLWPNMAHSACLAVTSFLSSRGWADGVRCPSLRPRCKFFACESSVSGSNLLPTTTSSRHCAC